MPSAAISAQLARLRAQAHACRSRAIALDAKLRVLGRPDLTSFREQLHDTAIRLDRAISGLLDPPRIYR